MDNLTIVVRPQTDSDMLPVSDAMRQVLDTIELFASVEKQVGLPDETFEWKLEKASTNSPFTVVAHPEARNPTIDVSEPVKRVKSTVSEGLRGLINKKAPPPWMGPEQLKTLREVFTRNKNGVGRTDINLESGDVITIDEEVATAGLEALAAINVAVDALQSLPERVSYGEIVGLMLGVGLYKRRPAIRIWTDLYEMVPCVLTDAVVKQFGREHAIAEVWEGRSLGITGRLYYAAGGGLRRIEVTKIREIERPPHVDLASIADADFTSGMDPIKYIDRLHNGESR